MSDKPIVYVEGGITYYRASSLTMCPRAFIFARQGHPSKVPSSMQEAFDYGTQHEAEVLEMMRRRGYDIYGEQDEIIIPVRDSISIIGHIDGMTSKFKGALITPAVVEVKCLNHENTEKFLDNPYSFPYYMAQVTAYMQGTNVSRVLFAIYDKDEDELKEVSLDTGTLPAFNLLSLINEREQCWSDFQSADIWPTCITTQFCPFYYLHEEDVIDDPELEGRLTVLTSIQARLASLSKLEETVKAQVKTYLDGAAVKKGRVGQFKFSYSSFTTKRLSTRRVTPFLKEINRYDEFVDESPSTRLSVERIDNAI